jgi:hypothetical protein
MPRDSMSKTFTDRNGCTWTLYDYRVVAEEKQKVPLNDLVAECRAFESPENGTVLVYTFGQVSYRTTEPNVLEGQLLFAKPLKSQRPRNVEAARKQPSNDATERMQA